VRAIDPRWLGRRSFADALAVQEEVDSEVRGGRDVLLLMEHEPVYTTGRGGRAENLPTSTVGTQVPVLRIGRGGDATYHGPGQLVGYPIVDLRAHGGDVHRYLRALESGIVATLADHGIAGRTVARRTGVWVGGAGERKIASIGIGVRRGVTRHGFALNVSVDLGAFARIVPCGIADVVMTSMAAEGVDPVPTVAAVAATAARRIVEALEHDRAAAIAGSGR
jgi:lipoyl(octanoyl) transferase